MKLFTKSQKIQYFRQKKREKDYASLSKEYLEAMDTLTGVEIELYALEQGYSEGCEKNVLHRIEICKINLKHVKKYK